MIMASAAAAAAGVVGLSTGKRFHLSTSSSAADSPTPSSSIITAAAKKSSPSNIRRPRSVIKALKDPSSSFALNLINEEGDYECHPESESESESDFVVDAVLLLHKSMLEKQWNLTPKTKTQTQTKKKKIDDEIKEEEDEEITCSGTSARRRRMNSRRRVISDPEYKQRRRSDNDLLLLLPPHKGYYVKGVASEQLLTHAQVVQLSHKIKAGLSLEDRRSRLKQRLGCEPSDEQLASSLHMSRANLQSKLIECSLAREKLAMSNIRLVMSIAQRYDNMGAQMPDLIQGGLIGLLRGIEKFDSSKGFKISTYVYWWIRQGVSRALVESSRTLRLPTHLHERLSLIRNAKARLEERGITPSVHRIAESLNMTERKVRNATEAVSKVFSLDREAYPSLNGLPGETLHSYIADTHAENNPWTGVDEWALKNEVDKLIDATLREREREIIRLYYGLDNECLTWEDISRRIGLSRERVRQVGLVALEKLKHAARKSGLEAMLIQH